MEGPEAEFRAATLGNRAEAHHLPIDMLLSPVEFRQMQTPVEDRAVTSVADAALTEGNQQTIAGRVFARSIATFLGIPMPTVGVGVVGYPRLDWWDHVQHAGG